jgi:hypothetical protein
VNQNPNNSESYRIRLEYRFFSSTLEGNAAKGTGGVPGTEFDLKDDLGFVDDRTWEARGAIKVGAKWKLRGGYTALDWGGQIDLAGRIRFDDTTFNAGESVSSSLKGGYYGGDLEFDVVSKPQGFFGITAGARAPDIDFVIAAPNSGKREQGTYRPVSPVLGVIGRLYAGKLSLEGSVATFAEISGRKVTEAEIGARIHISDRLALSGGYRYVAFKASSGGDLGDFADIRAAGWVYGLELGL